jgi:hypothetical protein
MSRLLLLSAFIALSACSKPITVVVGDGLNLPCEAAIPEGPTLRDMTALQTTLAGTGNSKVLVYANRGTSERCIGEAKDAARRAGKQVEVEREAG